MRDGLSQNTVFSIAVDAQDYMWFATYDGINKYDGYNITTYHVERDPDFVQVAFYDPFIFVDSSGGIWAYDGGISKYDVQSDSFQLCQGVIQGPVSGIVDLPGGHILIATGGELVELDRNTGKKVDNTIFLPEGTKVRSISSDNVRGLVAIGTEDGRLIVMRLDNMAIIDDFTLNFRKSPIVAVHFHGLNEIWAISDEVYRADLKIRSVKQYKCVDASLKTPVNLSYLAEDKNGIVFVGNFDSIFRYDIKSDIFEDITKQYHFPNNIKSLFFDIEGGMWVGSFRRGVFYYFDDNAIIKNIDIGLSSPDLAICSVVENPEGKILISIHNQGFVEYDPSSGKAEILKINPEFLHGGGVMSYIFDKNSGFAYFGNGGGITCYSKDENRFFPLASPEAQKIHVNSFVREDSELIWVGALSGLFLFNTKSGSLTRMQGSENLFIYKLFRDNGNILWVATGSGLFKTKLSRNAHSEPICGPFVKVSSAQDVHDILKVEDKLYVAARNGLFIVRPSGEISSYNTSDGLSSNFLNGLEADSKGNVWIGTEYGLDCLDAVTGRIIKYHKEDGIDVDYFTKNAHCTTSDGFVYFGGVGGLCRIDSDKDRLQISSKDPLITGIYANGIKKQLDGSSINLDYWENNLNFSFAVQNYSSKGKNTFFYRLSEIDNEWRYTSSSSSVTYPSLRPGHYTFELYSTNKNSFPSKNKITIHIRIRRPWYFSTVAILAYFLLFALMAAFVIRLIVRRYRTRTTSAIMNIREQSQAEIDKLKVLNLIGRTLSQEETYFVMKMVNIIEANISNPSFGVEMLASKMCMSRSNLFLRYKNITGDSASHLIRIVRFNEACRLLSETDKTVEEIALETGFSSSAAFSTAFKQIKGVSPTMWRH